MNSKIKTLNKRLSLLESDSEQVEVELQAAWNEVFKDMTQIRDAVNALELSNEYATDRHGEICQWVRFDSKPFKECRTYFETYLQNEHFVNVDWSNGTLEASQGPSIVINDDGDVYDQDNDTFIIDVSDYRDAEGTLDEPKRNELIEKYMEKTGYFPGVFSVDRNGNVFPIDTKA